MFNLFGKTAPEKSHAIAFHPELIARLKDDHVVIFHIWQNVIEHATAGNNAAAQLDLAAFREALKEHQDRENKRLYYYLTAELSDQRERAVNDAMQREMRAIWRVLTQFFDTYTKPIDKWTSQELDDFIGRLDELTTVLQRRVEVEEDTLYPLYRD